MQIIINYLGVNILKGILLTILLLLSIDLLFYFINELRYIDTGNYNLLKICEFVALSIPRKLYNITPWGVLMGTLISLGSMSQNQELLFIRSIGISVNKLALYSSVYILFFTGGAFMLGELLAPPIEVLAQKHKTIALSNGKTIATAYGVWTRVKNRFININEIVNHHNLRNITIYEFNDNWKLQRTIFANTAQFMQDKNCSFTDTCHQIWLMEEVVVHNINLNYLDNVNNTLAPDHQLQYLHKKPKIKDINTLPKITTVKLPTMQINNLLDVNILKASAAKNIDRLAIKSLLAIIKHRSANNLTVVEYQIAYWKRIMQPLVILIMGYLAVPFVLGPLRSSSKGTRLLVGVMLGIVFYLLNELSGPLATVMHIPPFIAVILPSMLFGLLGIYLASKV